MFSRNRNRKIILNSLQRKEMNTHSPIIFMQVVIISRAFDFMQLIDAVSLQGCLKEIAIRLSPVNTQPNFLTFFSKKSVISNFYYYYQSAVTLYKTLQYVVIIALSDINVLKVIIVLNYILTVQSQASKLNRQVVS